LYLGVKRNSRTPSPDESQKLEDELMLRHTTLCAFVVFIMAMGAAYALTPEEDVCGKYSDNAWGLCNAYCTAMDCDSEQTNASGYACIQVAANFTRATGEESMPCEDNEPAAPTDTQAGSCPCNFSLPFWTDPDRVDAIVQILPSRSLNFCIKDDPNTCLTCSVNHMTGSYTLLSVIANRFVPDQDPFVPDQDPEEDKLLFFAYPPPSLSFPGGCGVDTNFASGFSYTTEDFELPLLTNEEFVACALDIEALASVFDNMCIRR
jgi:hypothetical protein